jgi:hypothetical protein
MCAFVNYSKLLEDFTKDDQHLVPDTSYFSPFIGGGGGKPIVRELCPPGGARTREEVRPE